MKVAMINEQAGFNRLDATSPLFGTFFSRVNALIMCSKHMTPYFL